jgi:predicted transcriptional regulator of viral defense system
MLDVPSLRKAIAEWVEEKRKEAAKDLDYVKDTYRKRAAVIGFRCGVIAHILSGSNTETHSTITFATTMAQYALDEQIKLFGDAFKRQMNDDRVEPQRRGINHSIFDQLPEKFTINDLHMLKPESTQNTLSVVIHRWKRDGWIQRIRKNEYKKL